LSDLDAVLHVNMSSVICSNGESVSRTGGGSTHICSALRHSLIYGINILTVVTLDMSWIIMLCSWRVTWSRCWKPRTQSTQTGRRNGHSCWPWSGRDLRVTSEPLKR